MTTVYDYGSPQFYPNWSPWGGDALAATASTGSIDAAGEEIFFMGHCFIDGRPASAKTISSAGGKIHILFGDCTFVAAAGATVMRVGIQDVGVTTAPARGDGTYDVYDDLVSATDTITDDTYKTITMSNGTKSITHGDLIAITLGMTARGGADTVGCRVMAMGDTTRFWPQTVVNAPAATYSVVTRYPNAIIEFDDGTLGWLYGTVPMAASGTTVTYDLNTTPDEYGCTLKFPRPVSVDGLWGFTNPSALGGPTEALLYSTPTGTPAVLGTINIDHDQRNANALSLWTALFAQPIALSAGVEYGVCFRPTTADDFQVVYLEFSNANFLKAVPGGAECAYITRTGNTGAFAKTTTRRLLCGVLFSSGDDAAGGSGGNANILRGSVVA